MPNTYVFTFVLKMLKSKLKVKWYKQKPLGNASVKKRYHTSEQIKIFIRQPYMLNYFLNERFNLEFETAEKITTLFLKYFRETLQSAEEEVNEWRLSVWKRALGAKYAHLADEVYKEWLLLRYNYVKVSSEVKSFLSELRAKYRLAIISNGTSDAQWEKIRECGLKSYFDVIVISGDTPWKKPDPRIFLKTCDELNVKPEQCIIIGDRVETDIEGGKKANLAATIWIRFDPSYQRLPDENNCPDFIVDNVMGLKQILSQLNCSQNDKTR